MAGAFGFFAFNPIEYRFMLGQSKTYDELAAELAR
jgi:hypothetical protein